MTRIALGPSTKWQKGFNLSDRQKDNSDLGLDLNLLQLRALNPSLESFIYVLNFLGQVE